jgi:hypothetical protein
MNRILKQPSLEAFGVLMLLGWMMICVSVSARAQTEERTVNVVDTAAILARLHSRTANSFTLEDSRRPEYILEPRERSTEANLSPRHTEPVSDNAVVDGESREVTSTTSSQSTPSDAPKFQLTPYIWFSSFKGDVGALGRVTRVDAKFADIIDELNLGAMVTFEARWGGRWRFLADTMYMNFSDDRATPGPLFSGAQVTSKTFIFDPEIGYAVAGNEAASFDVMGGFRLWHLDNRLELRQGDQRVTASGNQTWVDPVVGFRLKAALSRAAYLTAKADIGGFGLGSELSWQLFGGLGLNLSPRVFTVFGYRHLDVDYRNNGLIFDVALSGFVGGFGFRF